MLLKSGGVKFGRRACQSKSDHQSMPVSSAAPNPASMPPMNPAMQLAGNWSNTAMVITAICVGVHRRARVLRTEPSLPQATMRKPMLPLNHRIAPMTVTPKSSVPPPSSRPLDVGRGEGDSRRRADREPRKLDQCVAPEPDAAGEPSVERIAEVGEEFTGDDRPGDGERDDDEGS